MRLFDDFKELQDIASDIYYRHAFWCKIQDDATHLINNILSELKSDLKLKINESLNHYGAASLIGNPNNFDDFYNKVVEAEKRIRLENIVEAFPNRSSISRSSISRSSISRCSTNNGYGRYGQSDSHQYQQDNNG